MPSICAVCNGACCSSLPFVTARQIWINVSSYSPEAMALAIRILHPDETDKTVCAFFAEEEGCVLEEADKPSICDEFKCDLFLLAERDPQLSRCCVENGHIIMSDPFQNNYLVMCDPNCQHKGNCPVPCRQDIVQ